MKIDELVLNSGENAHQTATIEGNDKTIDYEVSQNLTYSQILSMVKALNVISEFYDVKAACSVKNTSICAVALGPSLADAVQKTMDSNPVEFMESVIVVSCEVDSEVIKFLKQTNVIVAPKYTKNALELLQSKGIAYVTINTPLKDYKKYLSNEVKVTPLGTLTQTPNLSELNRDSFKVVSKQKPTVEQIEDAVFAWKIAKYVRSQAIVVAKDLKTVAIYSGSLPNAIEDAMDYSCEMSKEAILASDLPMDIHSINVAAQGRIGLIIVPCADKDTIALADKYNMALITTGITNISV